MSRNWRSRLLDLLPGISGALVFTLLCISFFAGGIRGEDSVFAVSLDQPWGILTSTYVHANFDHLRNNISALLIFSAMVLLTSFWTPRRVRRSVGAALLFLLFFTGPVVGSAEYILWLAAGQFEISSCGASDVVYALSAMVLVSFGLNIPLFWKLSSGRRKRRGARALFLLGILVIFFFFSSLSSPEVFFSVAPGVDVFAHVTGFFWGLLISLYFLLPAYRGLL